MSIALISLVVLMVAEVVATPSTALLLVGEPAEWAYAELAEAHLGGDTFERKMIWVSGGEAQLATVRSDGGLVSLEEGKADLTSYPALPEETSEPPKDKNAPPLLVEGRGAVGLAARWKPEQGGALVEIEESNPPSPDDLEAFRGFMAALEDSVTAKSDVLRPGRYVQARPMPQHAAETTVHHLKAQHIESSRLLQDLLEQPFKLVSVSAYEAEEVPSWIADAELGRTIKIEEAGTMIGIVTYGAR